MIKLDQLNFSEWKIEPLFKHITIKVKAVNSINNSKSAASKP